MERYMDARGRTFRVPRGMIQLVHDLEWAVEADSAQDRNRRTEQRRTEARDALFRFLARETTEPSLPLIVEM